MSILSLKEFMEKYSSKDDTLNETQIKKFLIILFIPESQKHILIKGF